MHLKLTSLIPSFRYHVTLNAPTAMVEHADEIPVTYLNKGQVYWISIVGMAPPSTAELTSYRTSVRITFEAEECRTDPTRYWQLWKQRPEQIQTFRLGEKLLAVEYPLEAALSAGRTVESSQVHLETALLDSFSVLWTTTEGAAGGYGALECIIPVKFNFLATDFTPHSEVNGVPVRLCVKTEMIRREQSYVDTMLELCHCQLKVFRDHGAERKLWNDAAHIKKTVQKTKRQMSQRQDQVKSSADQHQTASDPKSPAATIKFNVKQQKRSWLRANKEENKEFDEEKLYFKLQTLQNKLLSSKPVSILNQPGDEHDDPDLHPTLGDGELRNIGNGLNNSETSFWTGGNQYYGPPSIQSRSSSMNSSLHGTPTFDPDEQNPVFESPPRPRLQQSTGYYNEPALPSPGTGPYKYDGFSGSSPLPAPRHIARLSPDVYPSSSVIPSHISQRQTHKTNDAPPTLPPPPVDLKRTPNPSFDCDICGETVKVEGPHEWQ